VHVVVRGQEASASLYDEYDLLFIQELPWQHIRSAPSSALRDGKDVIGHLLHP